MHSLSNWKVQNPACLKICKPAISHPGKIILQSKFLAEPISYSLEILANGVNEFLEELVNILFCP